MKPSTVNFYKSILEYGMQGGYATTKDGYKFRVTYIGRKYVDGFGIKKMKISDLQDFSTC